jgi:hypothetical protein
MFFLALAIGVAIGSGDDELEWRSKDDKKTRTIRPLADDWDDDSTPAKQTGKPVKPMIRQISAPADDFEKDVPKPGQWRAPASKTTPPAEAKAKKSNKDVIVDDQIMKADAIIEPDDVPFPPGQRKSSSEPVIVQAPAEDRNALKPVPMLSLLELPKGLKSIQPLKPSESGPTETQTKNKKEPTPKASDLPTLPNVGSSPNAPSPPKPMTTPPVGTPSAKPVENSVSAPVAKPAMPPIAQPPKPTQPVPTSTPTTTAKIAETPMPQPAPIAMSAPMLMENRVDDSANVCLPFMDAVSAWKFETRSFLLWWDQPATHAFVRDGVADVGILSGVDYDFKKQFAQQLSLERRIDAATAIVLSGLVTEEAHQGAGAIAFGGLDLGIDGPGSGVLRNLSGFSGRATSRLWKAEMDFVRHFLQRPDTPIHGRVFGGPQFIGVKETFAYRADGAVGDVVFDARTDNTLFGADVGAGVTFQPWYSNLGVDVSGRYGLFANSFDVRNDFYGPRSVFVGFGEDGTCRLATSAELNIEATLRIARNVSLLAGWRLWHIQGIGRAASQVPTSVASPTLVTTNSGTLFAHGLFIGATIGWGGVGDPCCRYGSQSIALPAQ